MIQADKFYDFCFITLYTILCCFVSFGRGRCGDPAPAGSWGSPAAAASPGCGSGALAAGRGCCGDPAPAGIRKITGGSCFTWLRIRRPGGRPWPLRRSGAGRDPEDHRQQLRHLGAYCFKISATSAAAAASRSASSSFLYL